MNGFHVLWETWWRQFSPILVLLDGEVSNTWSVTLHVPHATVNKSMVAPDPVALCFPALSCSWPAGSWSGAATGMLGSSSRQSCAR